MAELAEARDQLSASASNTRPWNKQFNFLGALGEAFYSHLTGLPMNTEVAIRDGGTDFPGVDVKTTPHWQSPRLLRLSSDPLKAAVYFLVAADLENRRVREVGYATRAMLRSAPEREYGYGPTRTLLERELLTAHAVVPAIFSSAG